MKIGYDYDDCLSEYKMQELARKFIESGHSVFIITSRSNNQGGWTSTDKNGDLERVAKELSITEIIYTSHEDKYKFMPEDTDLFFDDSNRQVNLVNKHFSDIVGICIKSIINHPPL